MAGAAQETHQRRNGQSPSASPAAEISHHPKGITTPFSDVYNAETFTAEHGENLRYCPAWGTWLLWSGTHWQKDELGAIMQLAPATSKAMLQRAIDTENEKWLKHAVRTLSHDKLTAMYKQAQTFEGIAVTPHACDTDPWLLNCLNGTLDLRTGRCGSHVRSASDHKMPADRLRSQGHLPDLGSVSLAHYGWDGGRR